MTDSISEQSKKIMMQTIENSFEDFVAASVKRVESRVKSAASKAYKSMAMFIQEGHPKSGDAGSTYTPKLGPLSRPWRGLTGEYLLRKRNKQFFRNTGNLQTVLQTIDPGKYLGEPLINFIPASFGGGVTVSTKVWKGQKRTIARDTRGRFVSAKNLKASTPARFIIDPYPKIETLENLNEQDFFPLRTAQKLANARADDRNLYRPLAGPFLDWYADTTIRNAIRGAL